VSALKKKNKGPLADAVDTTI